MSVYIDPSGAVRSTASDRVIAPAGKSPQWCLMQAGLLAKAAGLLQDSAEAVRALPAEGRESACKGMTASADTSHPVAFVDVMALAHAAVRDLRAAGAVPERGVVLEAVPGLGVES